MNRGFSLIETVIASALTLLLLVTALNSLAFVVSATGRQSQTQQATDIARYLMAEIVGLPFEDPLNAASNLGLEADEVSVPRGQWDDCDDYHGWYTSNLTDRDGSPLAMAVGWSASVAVSYASLDNPEASTASASTLKRIQLTLSSPNGRAYTFFGLRCREGVLLEPRAGTNRTLAHADVRYEYEQQSRGVATRIHNQQRFD